ncbi:MAG: hypothetical protein LKF87_15650 [Clostridium tyrobutyricum]|jgi:hypothetical protein|uniref:hypothetical protein n=1 Tax=Clostridium tyrobutyricum TaxID=1519 RepID=UPI00242C7EC9|nr:hypothetical protein [Clostridium tyrobutyricum]MCH4201111.1 hypothetical protein [Clostridium tyrobutyricum]MCH4238495.1 hypothetical protein [Clostridium tyrobutyricum]MCH4260340.1 hypothetical protein [Clostridium tyrobutyricum]
MGFFSKLLGKRGHRDSARGSNYYKREGFFSRLFEMFGSFSNPDRRHNNQYHDSYRNNHDDRNYHRKKYRSSWS